MEQKKEETNIAERDMVPNDGMYEDKDAFWFVGNNDNILYRLKTPEMIIERIAVLPIHGVSNYREYPRCIKKDSLVYCVPDIGKCVQIYDVNLDSFQQITIGSRHDARLCIMDFWMEDGRLWCVSCGWNQIIEVNLQEKRVAALYDIFDGGENKCGLEATKVGQYIYCVSKETPCIVEFDICSYAKKEYRIATDEKGFNTIASDGKYFYLTGYSSAVYRWNREGNELMVCRGLPEGYFRFVKAGESFPRFYQTAMLERKVVFVPCNSIESVSDYLLCMDKETGELSMLDFRAGDTARKAGEQFTVEYIRNGKVLGIRDDKIPYIKEVDIDAMEIHKKVLFFDRQNDMKFLSRNIWDMGTQHEGVGIKLDILCMDGFGKRRSCSGRGQLTGKKIWERIGMIDRENV